MPDINPETHKLPALSLGLLLCDDVPEDGRERFGDYFGMFSRGLKAADEQLTLTPYDAYKGELPNSVADHDGYVISGSSASVFENRDWIPPLMQFVRDANESDVKVVGICFGHQLIAHALGGRTVRSDQGWGFGIHSAKLNRSPDWLDTNGDNYRLIVIHQDQVDKLPPDFYTLASNDFCPHSMITNGRNMLGIQGHPEFDKSYCQYRAEFRRELLGEDKFSEAISLLAHHDLDSADVLRWVSSFLRHPSEPVREEPVDECAA